MTPDGRQANGLASHMVTWYGNVDIFKSWKVQYVAIYVTCSCARMLLFNIEKEHVNESNLVDNNGGFYDF